MQAWVGRAAGLAAVADQPGAGAAGGLGCGAAAGSAAGANRVRRWSPQAIGLDGAMADADLVVTGEGTYDSTSLRGKVVGAVAAAAGRRCPALRRRRRAGEGRAARGGRPRGRRDPGRWLIWPARWTAAMADAERVAGDCGGQAGRSLVTELTTHELTRTRRYSVLGMSGMPPMSPTMEKSFEGSPPDEC